MKVKLLRDRENALMERLRRCEAMRFMERNVLCPEPAKLKCPVGGVY